MAQLVGPRGQGYTGYRIRTGNVVGLVAMPFQTSLIPIGGVRVIYDDGGEDDLYFDPSITSTAGTEFTALTKPAKRDGWVVTGSAVIRASGFPARAVTGYGQLFILTDVNASVIIACIGQGPIGLRDAITVGQFPTNDYRGVFVFQGTVAEDATAGTHVCTLTVTPGAGNALELLYGLIVVGNTATSQTVTALVDDGTNELYDWYRGVATTTASTRFQIPHVQASSVNTNEGAYPARFQISGTMRLVLTVSTTAVSVTQTFAIVGLVKNGFPSTTLNDTIGTSTNTTNTSGVF